MKITRYKHGNETVYGYPGYTYGCLGRDEIATTKEPAMTPFTGIDKSKLVEDGFVEISDEGPIPRNGAITK
jgi:hypothetical protein